jgi:hypothetical protein
MKSPTGQNAMAVSQRRALTLSGQTSLVEIVVWKGQYLPFSSE